MVALLGSCHPAPASLSQQPQSTPDEPVFSKPSPHGYGFRKPVPLSQVQPVIRDLDQLQEALRARHEMLSPVPVPSEP